MTDETAIASLDDLRTSLQEKGTVPGTKKKPEFVFREIPTPKNKPKGLRERWGNFASQHLSFGSKPAEKSPAIPVPEAPPEISDAKAEQFDDYDTMLGNIIDAPKEEVTDKEVEDRKYDLVVDALIDRPKADPSAKDIKRIRKAMLGVDEDSKRLMVARMVDDIENRGVNDLISYREQDEIAQSNNAPSTGFGGGGVDQSNVAAAEEAKIIRANSQMTDEATRKELSNPAKEVVLKLSKDGFVGAKAVFPDSANPTEIVVDTTIYKDVDAHPVYLAYYVQSGENKRGYATQIVKLNKDSSGMYLEQVPNSEWKGLIDKLRDPVPRIDMRRLKDDFARSRCVVSATSVNLADGLNIRTLVDKQEFQRAIRETSDDEILADVIEGPKLPVAGRMVSADLMGR